MTADKILEQAAGLVPPLSAERHKGQAGRVGVVGGSQDYTGAPFFASMAAMRFGCDMSFTLCSPDAGAVIKVYSPDLIVQRVLDPSRPKEEVKKALEGAMARMHAVVVGPGLGRDDFMQSCARTAIEVAKEKGMYIVVDADGLWLLQNDPEVIRGYNRAILTPNVMEFTRLCKAVGVDHEGDPEGAAVKLAKELGGPTILEKGPRDRITNGSEVIYCDAEGGLKRCGGQGDILAGCLGTFAGWCNIHEQEGGKTDKDRLLLLAGYGAAMAARSCSRRAFKEKKRAMLADDLLPHVGDAYQELFGDV